jgi:hypothetical protein
MSRKRLMTPQSRWTIAAIVTLGWSTEGATQPSDRPSTIGFSVAVGAAVPIGEFSDNFVAGPHLSAQLIYRPPTVNRLRVRGEFSVEQFRGRGSTLGRSALGGSVSVLGRLANAPNDSVSRLYLIGTFGFHQFGTQGSALNSDADISIGGGVGSEFRLLRRKMFTELRLLHGKSYGRLRWMPIVIGTEF